MGKATPWQDALIDKFSPFARVQFINPRRINWDSSWKQDLNEPKFYEQVTWELRNINDSDIVVFFFDPNTKSPISLLELGLVANIIEKKGKVLVCCPDGFWRKGNVDIVCQTYSIPLFTNLDTMFVALNSLIEDYNRVFETRK